MLNQPFFVFGRAWLEGSSTRSAASKLKATIIALVIGIVLGIIVMSGFGLNGFSALGGMFREAFNPIKIGDTLVISTIFIVVAIANAIAFKTGLFNIGVSGQMVFSGILTIIFGTQVMQRTGIGGVVLLIFLSMIFGALIAGLAGALKAYFNIHEVVTTILLNWALYFLGRWIMTQVPNFVLRNGQEGSVSLTSDMQFRYQVSNASNIILIVFGVVFALIVAFIFWKTTFGFKLKAVGLSPDAAEYAGINRRRRIMFAMGMSGMAAGLAGALVYVLQGGKIPSSLFSRDVLPAEGFDGIAIALLAFNNPIGVIPIALLFGALRNGVGSLSLLGLEPEVYDFIVGIIMYMAAISSLFIRYRIIQMLYFYTKWYLVGERAKLRIAHKSRVNELVKNNVQRVTLRRGFYAFYQSQADKFKALASRAPLKSGWTRKRELAPSASESVWAAYLNDRAINAYSVLRREYQQEARTRALDLKSNYDFSVSRYDRLIKSRAYESLYATYQASPRRSNDRKTYSQSVKALLAIDVQKTSLNLIVDLRVLLARWRGAVTRWGNKLKLLAPKGRR